MFHICAREGTDQFFLSKRQEKKRIPKNRQRHHDGGPYAPGKYYETKKIRNHNQTLNQRKN